MLKKHEKEDIDPFMTFLDNQYYEIMNQGAIYYYHLKTKQTLTSLPPAGSSVRKYDGTAWYEIKS